ncbi:hypothetical protein EDB86DRAFT_2830468 [Lactarius hatsudake]|nr:hypothetical protein EDB86DRAFT_2830468 [Lactarius hatsudake]
MLPRCHLPFPPTISPLSQALIGLSLKPKGLYRLRPAPLYTSAHSVVISKLRLGRIGLLLHLPVAASVPSFMEESLPLQLLTSGLDILNMCVPIFIFEVGVFLPLSGHVDQSPPFLASYVVCFYDWVISLDQEVAFIYPAPWNVVKAAYLFCRYYPLVVAPFQFWGLVGDHEQRVCESYYRVLFACTVPMVHPLVLPA